MCGRNVEQKRIRTCSSKNGSIGEFRYDTACRYETGRLTLESERLGDDLACCSTLSCCFSAMPGQGLRSSRRSRGMANYNIIIPHQGRSRGSTAARYAVVQVDERRNCKSNGCFCDADKWAFINLRIDWRFLDKQTAWPKVQDTDDSRPALPAISFDGTPHFSMMFGSNNARESEGST